MTALTSPLRILSSSSLSVPSTSQTPSIEANAAFTWPEAAVRSRSANPYEGGLGLPEKINPNVTTKINGNAMVQNSAARSRTKLFVLAMVRGGGGFTWRQSGGVRGGG